METDILNCDFMGRMPDRGVLPIALLVFMQPILKLQSGCRQSELPHIQEHTERYNNGQKETAEVHRGFAAILK